MNMGNNNKIVVGVVVVLCVFAMGSFVDVVSAASPNCKAHCFNECIINEQFSDASTEDGCTNLCEKKCV